jgi:UDPglucose 6-dehydrogenase
MNIVVAGTGYVGLVTGVCLSHVGHIVTCVDAALSKIEMMKQCVSPFYEPGLKELLKENYDAKRLDFTTDYRSAYKEADIIIISVGTPEREDGSVNLNYIYEISEQIAENIEKDHLV